MRSILIRTVGDAANGMGHVQRCLTLARALEDVGERVAFWTLPATPGHDRILAAGHTVYTTDVYPGSRLPGAWRALIVDVEGGPDRRFLSLLRLADARAPIIVVGGSGYTLRDYPAVREIADLEVYQSILPTDGPAERVLSGLEYIMIDPRYSHLNRDATNRRFIDGHVAVAMGGSDPHGLTAAAIMALDRIGRMVEVVIGPANGWAETALPENVSLWRAPLTVIGPLDGAALFVGAFGMLAYESMAAGVPCLLTNWSASHEETTVELERRGAAWSMGLWSDFNADDCRARVARILDDPARLERMAEAGRRLVDGQGVRRVAERIQALVRERVR